MASLLLCRSAACVSVLGASSHFAAVDLKDAAAASALFRRLLAAAVDDNTTADAANTPRADAGGGSGREMGPGMEPPPPSPSAAKLEALVALLGLWESEAEWAVTSSVKTGGGEALVEALDGSGRRAAVRVKAHSF
jgi:hypothetical protein